MISPNRDGAAVAVLTFLLVSVAVVVAGMALGQWIVRAGR